MSSLYNGSRLTAHGSRLTAHGSRLTAHGSRLTAHANSVPSSQSHSPTHKNLLIGAITNYTWDDVASFFNSYVQAGFENCGCVMFCGNMSEQTLSKIRSCGAETLPIPEKFSGACVNDFRWELYKDYLSVHAGDYGMVFTADVRDTIFQDDVFRFYGDCGAFLGIALEDNILTETCNKNWLIRRYGEAVYDSLKDNRIICTGTVWGTAHEFLAFTSVMADHINSSEYPYFRVCDQAAGNWLIYHEGMFKDITSPSTNQDGPIMTIGLTDWAKIKLDSQDRVMNEKGEIAAVIHQYDRKLSIVKLALRKYGAGMSLVSKLKQTHPQGRLGRVLRFLDKANRKGLTPALAEAIKRRMHR